MYTIEKIPSKRRVVLLLDKYQDHDRPQFTRDFQAAVLCVKGGADHFDILADFSGSMVMPQDIATDSMTLAQWLVANGLRRSANVSQSVTQQMQVRRVTANDAHFQMFPHPHHCRSLARRLSARLYCSSLAIAAPTAASISPACGLPRKVNPPLGWIFWPVTKAWSLDSHKQACATSSDVLSRPSG